MNIETLIKNRLKATKIIGIITFISILLQFLVLPSPHFWDAAVHVALPFVLLLCPLVVVSLLVYFRKFEPFLRSVKLLNKNKMIDCARDITLLCPTLPESGIFCGKNALICSGTFSIIPYSEIAMIYVYERKFLFLSHESIGIFTRDGEGFNAHYGNDMELNWLIEQCVLPYSPDALIGYSKEHRSEFKSRYPGSIRIRSILRSILGHALIALGILLFVTVVIDAGLPNALWALLITAIPVIGGLLLIKFGWRRYRAELRAKQYLRHGNKVE